MSVVDLSDGRRVTALYEFDRDWWVTRLDGTAQVAEGRSLFAVVRNVLNLPSGVVSPKWLRQAVDQLAQYQTPSGPRVMCRCCSYLTLTQYGHYEICPVCGWEDDPTTILEPGEGAGPGPNHVSLAEGRRNFAREGISNVRLKGRVAVRAPMEDERP